MVWRVASLALCVFFLVQFASLIVLHNNTAEDVGHQNVGHQAGGRNSLVNSGGAQARAEAAAAREAANLLKGHYLNAGKRDSGMGQTQQWLKVVSGSPHWMSPKDRAGSEALLESIEQEATSKFGMPAPSSPPSATPPQSAPESSKATADTGRKKGTQKRPGADSGKPFKSDAVSGLHTFYYAWYGNPALDGKWVHWNHQVLKHWAGPAVNSKYPNIGTKHTPPETIGSNFYPKLGPYSSRNASVVDEHVRMMAQAGIGVLVYSWWGRGLADENGDPTDEKTIALVGQACQRHNVKFTFHLEPYDNRNALSVKEDVKFLISKYRTHAAFYTLNHNAVFYVYDSYRTSKEEWQSVLGPYGALNPHSIRGTDHDCTMLGLWVDGSHGEDLRYGGFDGFYTYFATDGMTYGSTHSNWDTMRAFAGSNKMIFVPSIGPGYIDTAIRPWNSENTRNRESGEYYARSWRHALSQSPDIISITSFNEWHEGTQILLFQRVVLVH